MHVGLKKSRGGFYCIHTLLEISGVLYCFAERDTGVLAEETLNHDSRWYGLQW